jgi:hypothetical protein
LCFWIGYAKLLKTERENRFKLMLTRQQCVLEVGPRSVPGIRREKGRSARRTALPAVKRLRLIASRIAPGRAVPAAAR